MRHSEEFKTKVVKAVESGKMKPGHAIKKHGISYQTLRNWREAKRMTLERKPVGQENSIFSDSAFIALREENTKLKVWIADHVLATRQ